MWQHVNLFGSIEFREDDPDIDMTALAVRYANAEFWYHATRDDDEANCWVLELTLLCWGLGKFSHHGTLKHWLAIRDYSAPAAVLVDH